MNTDNGVHFALCNDIKICNLRRRVDLINLSLINFDKMLVCTAGIFVTEKYFLFLCLCFAAAYFLSAQRMYSVESEKYPIDLTSISVNLL